MRIALDSLPTDTVMLQQLVRDMAAALGEGQVEIDRLRLIVRRQGKPIRRRHQEPSHPA